MIHIGKDAFHLYADLYREASNDRIEKRTNKLHILEAILENPHKIPQYFSAL